MHRLIAFVVVAVASVAAAAQDYPSRQITLVAPYAPGGSTDLVARVLQEGLRSKLGQTVIVDNRPGGNGVIGTREVVSSAPDGYTLLIGAVGAQVIPATMAPNFPFDPHKDFTPIARTAEWFGVIMVRKDLPVSNLAEFVAYAKARPGKLNYGSSGYGSIVHLIAEVFMKQAGIAMQHVPYKGGTASVNDLLSGSLDVLFTSSAVGISQLANPNVKLLAVAADQRVKLMPDIPTFAQAGVPGVNQTSWMCVLGPAGLPDAIRDRLSSTLIAIVNEPETQKRLQTIGFAGAPAGAAEFGKFWHAEIDNWSAFVRERGLMQKP